MREPPKNVIDLARSVANESPCAKSHRGVVIFEATEDDKTIPILATGHNHPPRPFYCKGDNACRAACAKLCVHAEQDALHDLLLTDLAKLRNLHIVHVEIPADKPYGLAGEVVACDGPSCWQCSREILELARACHIAGVWLYEIATPFNMCPHAQIPIFVCQYCQGRACAQHPVPTDPTCECTSDERHKGLAEPPKPRWVFYPPQDFHFATLRHPKNNLPANLKDLWKDEP